MMLNVRWILLLLSLSVGAYGSELLAGPPPSKLDPKVRDALAATIAFYASKQSMKADAVTTLSLSTGMKSEKVESTSHLAFQRPDSFAFVDSGLMDCTLVSDGKKAVEYLPKLHRYTIEKPTDVKLISPKFLNKWGLSFLIGKDIFFGKELLTACGVSLTADQDLGLESLHGLKARHLQLTGMYCTVDVWLDSGSAPVLLQTRLTDETITRDHLTEQEIYLTDFSNWKFDQPIAPDTFVFHPPPDAQLVDELYPAPPPLPLGKPAPEFVAKSLDGSNVSLASLRGKIVVLDFWAPWCAACVAELPSFCQVINSMRDKEVVFYAVDDGDEASAITAFQKAKSLAFPVLLDPDVKVTNLYCPRYIPETVLIDRNGNVQVIEGYNSNLKEVLTQQLTDLLAGKDLNAAKLK